MKVDKVTVRVDGLVCVPSKPGQFYEKGTVRLVDKDMYHEKQIARGFLVVVTGETPPAPVDKSPTTKRRRKK